MPIDVTATRRLPHPRDAVTAYAFDWRHDHEWTQGIKTAELTREAPGDGIPADLLYVRQAEAAASPADDL